MFSTDTLCKDAHGPLLRVSTTDSILHIQGSHHELRSTFIQGVHYELHSTHTRCPLRTPFYTYKVFTMNTVLHIQGFHHELHSTLIQSFHQELHSTRVQNPATNQYTCLSLRRVRPLLHAFAMDSTRTKNLTAISRFSQDF